MVLNECGEIVREEWMNTGIIRSYVELDGYVVMPNHFHAILAINDRDPVGAVGARRCFARNEIARNEIETNTGQKTVANCRDDKTRATHRIAPT
ncbi:MAG TPA: hypothetical protein VEP69_03410, partial [Thermodesulfovibrionales bacterium]|nr:hypothetical protein [Thermodesulfovibrionales bacterium]